MRLTLLSVVLVACACVAGCGDNPAGPSPVATSPSAVDTTSARTLTFVSGETGEPVAGAAVLVDGQRFTTDKAGQVRLDGSMGADPLTASAEGFLERHTRPTAPSLSLWPKASPTGLDETVTARLVYNCPETGCAGGETLLRVADHRVFVVPAPEVRADPLAIEALERAAEKITASTGGQVVFTVWPSPPSGAVSVTVTVDADDADVVSRDAAAVTKRYLGGRAAIVRSVVVVRSMELARRTPLLLHELGHAFGLGHSPRIGDVMWNGPELYDVADFTPRERLSMALMLQRPPGNHFPDDDQDASAQSSRGVQVIDCR